MDNWFPQIATSSPEHFYYYFLITLFLLFILPIISTLVRKTRPGNGGSTLPPPPPGPPTLPLIGNLHQLLFLGGGGSSTSLPHHTLSKLAAKYGAVMRLQIGECSTVVISSPAAAKEVLRTKELSFPQRPVLFVAEIFSYGDHSSLIFSPYGHRWRRLRRLCVSELFSARRVASFRSIREQEVRDLVAAISSAAVASGGGGAVDLSPAVFAATSNLAARAAFGVKSRDAGEFLTLFDRVNEIATGFCLPDLYPSFKFLRHVTGVQSELQQVRRRIDQILDDMVDQHVVRAGRGDRPEDAGEEDLLDALIKLQGSDEVDFKITSDHLKAVVMDVFSAGSETSTTTIEWAMAELMNNPTAMEKAQSELRQAFKGKQTQIKETDLLNHNLTYLKAIVTETLRLHPPAPLLARQCIEPCEVGGYLIPAGVKVVISAYAIGRDPEIWSDPHCFKPERFLEGSTTNADFVGSNFTLIPFGGGRRICPGISFATAYVELALAQMLYLFDWSLPGGMKGGELDMSESFGATCRKKGGLVLVPTLAQFAKKMD